MIEIKQLSKVYPPNKIVVNTISFSVEKGEKLVLLGTSGCGKTTTLKMINRLIEPSSGTIYIGGENIMSLNPETLRKKIGYVIQSIGLFPHYTVSQNIAIVPQLLKWDKHRINNRIVELAEMLNLSLELLQKFPEQLSGGQMQRVGVARALAANPDIMLLDEPFGALDPINRSQIQQEFKKMELLKDKTMIMVTHDIFEALELADRICLMNEGKIQQIGTANELLFKPKNEFVKDFFQTHFFQVEQKMNDLKNNFSLENLYSKIPNL